MPLPDCKMVRFQGIWIIFHDLLHSVVTHRDSDTEVLFICKKSSNSEDVKFSKSILLTMGRDFYKILEISCFASDEEIKKALKKLALRYHPDKNQTSCAEEIFSQLSFYQTMGA